jgi:serine/threonine protein kinase
MRRKHMIVHRDLKPANLMLGGIPHETGTREMVRCRA